LEADSGSPLLSLPTEAESFSWNRNNLWRCRNYTWGLRANRSCGEGPRVAVTAEVTIVGGGVVGCAIAYNLAVRGCREVLLLEKAYLAGGSTGRCGAGLRQQWGTEMNCRLAQGSCRFFERMNEELGYDGDIEFKQGGYLLLAHNDRQWEQFRKNVALQNRLGIPSRLVDLCEAREIVPNLDTSGLVGCTFCGEDGHANPFHVTQAYADAARRLGVRIETFTEVTAVRADLNRVRGVVTATGEEISSPTVINAAGGWSQVVAAMLGIDLPVYSERHQILVTEPVAPLQGPMVMSFELGIYCQQTPHGSFIMGLGDTHEPKGLDTGHSWQFLRQMARRVTGILPVLRGVRVVRQWSGLYNITPDRQPILGGVAGLDGYYMAVGFSGHGFMIAPMVGEIMADHILGRPTAMPVAPLELARFRRGELIIEPSVV